MPGISIQREPDGSVLEVASSQCKILYQRPRPGVGVIRIEGKDKEELHAVFFNALEPDLVSDSPVKLFVDTRQTSGMAINIVEWADFLRVNSQLFDQVHVLVVSTVIRLSVKIVIHLSRSGNLIQIHTDAFAYNRHLQAALRTQHAA